MGVAISLRKDYKASFYKNMLLGLLHNVDANEMVLCTGFLQYMDNFGSVPYDVFDDEDSSHNNLLDAICGYRDVTLVGIKAKNTKDINGNYKNEWYREYDLAIDHLKKEIKRRGSKTKLRAWYNLSGEWHAKIALILRNVGNRKVPLAAIVGSSNLTRPAMSDSYTPKRLLPQKNPSLNPGFNMEADTLIYVEELKPIVEQQLTAYIDMEYGEIISYSSVPQVYGNKNINSEADVILAEYNDIMSQINATRGYRKI